MKISWPRILPQPQVERYRSLWLRAARGEIVHGLQTRAVPRTSTEPSELDALVQIVRDTGTAHAEREAARQGLLLACESLMWPASQGDSQSTDEPLQRLILAAEQALQPLHFERDPDPGVVSKLRGWLMACLNQDGIDPGVAVDVARLAATVELRFPTEQWKALYSRLDSQHQEFACRSVFAGMALTSLDEALYWLASIESPPFQIRILEDILPWLLDRKVVTSEGARRSLQRMMVYYPREVAGQVKASVRGVVGDVPDSNERDEALNSLQKAVLLWINKEAGEPREFRQFLDDMNMRRAGWSRDDQQWREQVLESLASLQRRFERLEAQEGYLRQMAELQVSAMQSTRQRADAAVELRESVQHLTALFEVVVKQQQIFAESVRATSQRQRELEELTATHIERLLKNEAAWQERQAPWLTRVRKSIARAWGQLWRGQ